MKCPNCKSKNTIKTRVNKKLGRKLVAGAIFTPLAWAVVGKGQKVGECFDCGNRWAA